VELACSGGNQECISVGGTDGFEVAGNTVHDVPRNGVLKEGICTKDGSANGSVHGNLVYSVTAIGVYVDGWDKLTHDIDVFANICRDVPDVGIGLACEMGGTLENIRVHNNVVYRCQYGVQIGDWGDPSVTLRTFRAIRIVNNTCVSNSWADWGGGIALDANNIADVVVRNNICANNLSFQIAASTTADPASYSIDHNLVFGAFGGEPWETRGEDYVEGDPRFVDPAEEDYRWTRARASLLRPRITTAALGPRAPRLTSGPSSTPADFGTGLRDASPVPGTRRGMIRVAN